MTEPRIYKMNGPRKKVQNGITCIGFTLKGNIIAGGGNGFLYILNRNSLKTMKKIGLAKKGSGITSITGLANGVYFAGASNSEIYQLSKTFDPTLIASCHLNRINDIAFPSKTSDLFITCSEDIRLWSTSKRKELLRITVNTKSDIECNCVCFTHDGDLILSGWSDGKIRAFGPESGKLYWTINDAHQVLNNKSNMKGVTCLDVTVDDKRLLSGGQDGQFRVWNIAGKTKSLEVSLKQHKSSINQIVCTRSGDEAISVGDDGSTIIWDLTRFVRSNILYQTTYFKGVCLLDDESQIVTCGSNKLLTYWDKVSGESIREIEAHASEINSVDITMRGDLLFSGGNDRMINVWDYDTAENLFTKAIHGGNILKVKCSFDDNVVVSIDESGMIVIWNNLIEERGGFDSDENN